MYDKLPVLVKYFLPHGIMLARYMLWSCICLCVYHMPVLHQNS